MTVRPTLRRYWREVALIALIVIPWVALFPLGLIWLWQKSLAMWWLLSAAILSIASFLLKINLKARAGRESEALAQEIAPGSREWGPREREAWRIVERLGRETEPFSFTDPERIREALERTVDSVAAHFHPGAPRARLRISLPEGLLLAERLLRDLRTAVITHVPGAQDIRLSDVALAKEAYDRYGAATERVYAYGEGLFRLVRSVGNPKGGFLAEASRLFVGQVGGFLSLRVRQELTAVLVREVGRAVIDLYSGRLRLDVAEIESAGRAESLFAPRDLVGPVRIILAGQVNAGKSSLLNALSERVQRNVGAVPTSEGPAQLLLTLAGRPEVFLIDTGGIGDPKTEEALLEQIKKADIVLWVASATQPARSPDVNCLQAMRAFFETDWNRPAPPILCAVTHVDQLSPKQEWDPPYDLVHADRRKARAIRDAVEHISDVLGIGVDLTVPLCVRSIDSAYNLDLLWNVIAASLDEGRARKLLRLQQEAGGFSPARVLSQMAAAGRWLARAARSES